VAAVERVGRWMRETDRITVLTGAGISTDSGIPDFRGPAGVWTRNPDAQRLVDIAVYRSDPQARRLAWQRRRDHPAWTAAPNAAHQALVELGRVGKLCAIITQNIDRLHQKAGSDPERVIELHGSMERTVCLSCRDRRPMADALARLAAGEPDPACLVCGGILKSGTVFFGESLDPEVLAAAQWASAGCELFVVVGTSLTVAPATWLPGVAADAGARVVIVNGGPTPYDSAADEVLREPIGTTLPALVARAVLPE
jgi:NAD-dependent deacetylase